MNCFTASAYSSYSPQTCWPQTCCLNQNALPLIPRQAWEGPIDVMRLAERGHRPTYPPTPRGDSVLK